MWLFGAKYDGVGFRVTSQRCFVKKAVIRTETFANCDTLFQCVPEIGRTRRTQQNANTVAGLRFRDFETLVT